MVKTAETNGKATHAADVDRMLAAARDLHERGFAPVPLRDGKSPGFHEWQKYEFGDKTFRQKLYKATAVGVGLIFGPRGRAVDFEYDTPAQRDKLLSLFPDGVPPVGPQYTSTHGEHYLFAWDDRLEVIGKAVLKIPCDDGTELILRIGAGGKGAQSAVPPSSGKAYKPDLSLDDCDPPQLPDSTIELLIKYAGVSKRPATPPATGEGSSSPQPVERSPRWDRCLSAMLKVEVSARENDGSNRLLGVCRQLKRHGFGGSDAVNRLRLYAIQHPFPREFSDAEILRRWDEADVRVGEALDEPSDTNHQPHNAGQWRLEIVDSKPRVYRLYSPKWSGAVELTTSQYLSWSSIRTQALEQRDAYLTSSFRNEWQGSAETMSLAAKLVETAEHVDAPVDASRDRVVAELLWDELKDSGTESEGTTIDPSGFSRAERDGSIVFKFTTVLERLTRLADKVTRKELSDLLTRLGATDKQGGNSSARYRLKSLDRAQLAKLRTIAGVPNDDQ